MIAPNGAMTHPGDMFADSTAHSTPKGTGNEPTAKHPAPSMDGVAEAEAWMRSRFPGALLQRNAGRVFASGKSGISGFESEYLLAACLGPAGSPGAPWKFNPDTREYLRYDPKCGLYRPEPPAAVEYAVARILEQCARESGTRRPERIRALQKLRHIRQVVEALKGVAPIAESEFERDLTCIHVANGILNLERLELHDFSPDRPARYGLPIQWDPAAPRPRRFIRFLARMFPSTADRRLAVRLLAMAMLGNPFQKVAIIYGASRSGKSTLTKLFGSFVGDEAYGQLRLELSGGRFEAASWIGKLVLAQLDAPEEILQANTNVLKAISGQDRFEAEYKFAPKRHRFTPTALPIITSNRLPRLRLEDDRDAWLHRLLILRTEAGPHAKPVREFEAALMREEGPGILFLVAREAQRLLGAGTLKLTRAQRRRVELMVDASDPIRTFVRHYVQPAQGATLYTADAYAAVKTYLRMNQFEFIPDGRIQRQFREAMETVHGGRRSNSLPPSPGKSTRGWRHFRLCDDG